MRRGLRIGLLAVTVGMGLLVAADQVLLPMLVHSRPAIRMPSVVGMSLRQAVEFLSAQGFVVHEVRYEASPTVPEGTRYPPGAVRWCGGAKRTAHLFDR
ncbi:MAG: PASTA domain-containing protein [Bacteroidota bacterium]|nr:PASTA domain-containing protein [Bacteroidota bacterium]